VELTMIFGRTTEALAEGISLDPALAAGDPACVCCCALKTDALKQHAGRRGPRYR
jgi:hypothetical protein